DGTHAGRPSGKDIRKLGGEGHGARPAVVPSVEPAQGGGETVGAAPDLERLLAPDEAASCAPTLEARRLEMNSTDVPPGGEDAHPVPCGAWRDGRRFRGAASKRTSPSARKRA